MKFFKNHLLLFFIFFVYLPTSYAQNSLSSGLIVQTKQGKLQGDIEDTNVFVWKAVRYAKPPIGDLRFKAPQPIENWEGVKPAIQYGLIAPQVQVNVTNSEQKTGEDCLFLNIWSTEIKNKKPVMVWIHGGGFYTGSGSSNICNGEKLAQKGDVVVVNFNYRLGALGFLYFDEIAGANKNFDSNIGIKDQIAALKMVKENIEAFGGAPENITLFGQSAGETSVLAVMATPSAKGLFNKVIAESPSTRKKWTPSEATWVAKMYLARLGVSENNLNELYKISADTIIQVAHNLIQDYAANIPGIGTFAPTIDNLFITQLLSDSTTNQNLNVPLLIGTTKDEMNLFFKVKAMPFEISPELIDRLIPTLCIEDKNCITSAYKKYPQDKSIINIMTEGLYRMPCIQKAEENSKNQTTYMYRFDWSSLSLDFTGYKSCHALDVFFVFNNFDTKVGKKIMVLANKRSVNIVSSTIQEALINFAKTSNPNNVGTGTWKKYNTTERVTMIFDKKNRIALDSDSKKRLSWQGVDVN